jgi:nitrate/TMAO reductase-like tetraheme cytochrome c subunit
MKFSYRIKTVRSLIVAAGIFAVLVGAQYFAPDSVSASLDDESTPVKMAKYTDFPHSAKAHQLECSKCHTFPSDNWKKVRPEADAFPDVTEYPKHESCLSCHRQQFFNGSKPAICSVCHVNPSPRDSTRFPFPNPRETFDQSPKGKLAESDFLVGFPHEIHVDIVSQNQTSQVSFSNAAFLRPDRRKAAEESCSVCHKTMGPQGDSKEEYFTPPPPKLGDDFWLKKGTFKTAPIGHITCFTCHSVDTGITPAPSDCAACHKLKPTMPPADFDPKLAELMKIDNKVMMDAWRRRESAGKFQHEFFAHVDLECATCHNVSTMKTAEPATLKVSIGACATCHATATSDDGGAINYEIDSRKANAAFTCVKCHTVFGKLPVPESHTKAVTAAAGK